MTAEPTLGRHRYVSVMIKAALYAAQDASARMCDDSQIMWDAYFAFAERGKVPKNDIWEKWQKFRDIAERNLERMEKIQC